MTLTLCSPQLIVQSGNTIGGSITVLLTSYLTDLESSEWQLTIFCFHFQNWLIQTSKTGGQWYSDTSPFSIPWFSILLWNLIFYAARVIVRHFAVAPITFSFNSLLHNLNDREATASPSTYFCFLYIYWREEVWQVFRVNWYLTLALAPKLLTEWIEPRALSTIFSEIARFFKLYHNIEGRQRIYHVGYTSSHSNTEVKQTWTLIILGWDSSSIQSTVLQDSLCLNQVIETCHNQKEHWGHYWKGMQTSYTSFVTLRETCS